MTIILSILQWIAVLLLVLLVFNVVIIVHEWGHFLAARWRGLRVDKFQIWFGKPIWKKTINGVQYGLGCVPFGGFVALPQMASMETIEGSSSGTEIKDQLPPIKPLDKIIVAFAGPLFSFLLAVVCSLLVWGIGKPVHASELDTTISYVSKNMPANGVLMEGDRILKVNGNSVRRFQGLVDSVIWEIVSAEGDDIQFTVEREGKPVELTVHAPVANLPEFKEWAQKGWLERLFQRKPTRKVGIGWSNPNLAVAEILENSPAAQAGLAKDDKLKTVNGRPLLGDSTLWGAIEESKGQPITLGIERAGQPMEISVTPRKPDEPKDAEMNIGVALRSEAQMEPYRPDPVTQIKDAIRGTLATIQKVFFSPKSELTAGQMGGAVQIMSVYHQLFQIKDGWKLVLWFTVVLNINLAILNMLPFPVLDGGHITMAIGEMIRRRPMRGRFLEFIQNGFALLLIGFMLYILLKDVGGLAGAGEKKGETIKYYPPKSAS